MKILLKIGLVMSLMISLSGCGNTNKGPTTPIIDPPIIETPSENAAFVVMYASEDVNMREGIGIDSSIIKVIDRG